MIVIVIIILVIDLLSYKGLRLLLKPKSKRVRMIVYIIHWMVPVILFLGVILLRIDDQVQGSEKVYRNFILGGFFLTFYFPKLIFASVHVLDDLMKGLLRIYNYIVQKPTEKRKEIKGKPISRMRFITTAGLVLASFNFISLLYGMVSGRFNFKIYRLAMNLKGLPKEFNGYKIVQISDIHIGGFHGHGDRLKEAVELINLEQPDLILFTGDMVNNFADEMLDFKETLKLLKAKDGKFSILGNHDYGDYHSWDSEEEKKANLNEILQFQEEMGFKVLLNESVALKKGEAEIGLIGVENWGKPPFAQYGDFKKAQNGVSDLAVKILMSHDPSHWDAEITKNTDVHLTLSGHTHGMQFGVELGNLKWSPVQYKYPQWAGLYKDGDQYLYVNRGLGTIGYPGRVGMPPEITVFKLEA